MLAVNNCNKQPTGRAPSNHWWTFRVLGHIFPLWKGAVIWCRENLEMTARADQFHEKCPKQCSFPLPWKLHGFLHPSKLHCPDVLYFPTKYTEWRDYLIMWPELLLASSIFFSNNRMRFWMTGPLESTASMALSCVKNVWPAFVPCTRDEPQGLQ